MSAGFHAIPLVCSWRKGSVSFSNFCNNSSVVDNLHQPHIFTATPQSPARILIAEDDEAVRALIQTLLKRNGYTVDTAKNGAEAIAKVAECDYQAILLDLNMPITDGHEVMAHLERTTPGRVAERVIVITAVSNAELRKLDGRAVFRVIRKPFDLDVLLTAVAECCRASVEAGLSN
jgi:two-component system response regulator MprA